MAATKRRRLSVLIRKETGDQRRPMGLVAREGLYFTFMLVRCSSSVSELYRTTRRTLRLAHSMLCFCVPEFNNRVQSVGHYCDMPNVV